MIGIESSLERAHWLARGFGEALPTGVTLAELEQRALRLSVALDAVERHRDYGPLRLDLILRDGVLEGRRLGLHPRELALMWRLAQAPGKPVLPDDLLAEVWRMNFRPETNSLAVHVCRLRAKLAAAGLNGAIGTTPEGAYRLQPLPKPAIPLAACSPGRDDHVRATDTAEDETWRRKVRRTNA